MRLSAQSLSLALRGRKIIRDVSLEVTPGETLALVGPNGSGKSTLLRLLAGLVRPDWGAIRLEGQPLARLSRRGIAQRIALVEQQADTAERLTARAAVELGRTPWLSALASWSERDERQVARALDAVEMTALADRSWATLSGGERQRLHIARALAQEPGLLLLDEPTNHLDIHHQLAILGFIRQLPITTVIALHDLNQAMGCDRVAMLDGGRLVACGPPPEVLRPDLVAHVFGIRVRRVPDPAGGPDILTFSIT
ncbi:ABC transporter ATP-binding protein [Paracoccus sp. MA]|uniref:ABC transporter ATP-binding protein n=1 Tax=Paracoccus sp. MA TaxID=2895796 RepID=UPI001E375601|nr:ABC transporter ATP-binding protein [Paracoccus sp. MA]UFM64658.1 ABC transporter ATP-binding protein [Paracoccus sp. MA]